MLRPLGSSALLDAPTSALPPPPTASPIMRLASVPVTRTPRILDFDIENRPLSYWYDGRCTAEVTAIAWRWTDETEVTVRHLSKRSGSGRAMLRAFAAAYAEADVVTGHYVRRHDLPILNGAMIEHALPPLGRKLVSDTRLDLTRMGELAKSQEALAAMLGLSGPKVGMSQADWRDANRLTPSGVSRTLRRVCGDVDQHVAMRAALLERGMLRAPRWWSPR